MKTKGLMVISYAADETLIASLKSCLDMCDIKYVIYKEYGFTDGKFLYKIYIDKNKCTWEQVMREVCRVRPTMFKYENGKYIKDGELYVDCGIVYA